MATATLCWEGAPVPGQESGAVGPQARCSGPVGAMWVRLSLGAVPRFDLGFLGVRNESPDMGVMWASPPLRAQEGGADWELTYGGCGQPFSRIENVGPAKVRRTAMCIFCGRETKPGHCTPWPKGGVVCEGCYPTAVRWLKEESMTAKGEGR